MSFESAFQQVAPRADAKFASAVRIVFPRLSIAYHVTTPLRIAHFLAQTAHESGGFTRMLENLNYSAERIPQVWPRLASRAHELARNPEKLANAAYAGKIGNGNEASGDGWRHRGRGPMQLTGRSNYRHIGQKIGVDLEGNPDLAAEPGVGLWIALAFWDEAGCNAAADADDVADVTRRINGPAMLGLSERRALTAKAMDYLTERVT